LIPNNTAVVLQGQLGNNFNLMPVMEVGVATSVVFPFCFLSGYIIFSDAAEVAF
jgi:hypothetical protein